MKSIILMIFTAFTINIFAATYDLSNLSYVRVNNETILTWNIETGTGSDESNVYYVIQLSPTEDFTTYVQYTSEIEDINVETLYSHNYNLGDTLDVYARLYIETLRDKFVPRLDEDGNVVTDEDGNTIYDIITERFEASNVLTVYLGTSNPGGGSNGHPTKNYTYYVPHVANNDIFSTYLFIDYSRGEDENELQFVRSDAFSDTGFSSTYMEIEPGYVGYLSTSDLYNYPVNRELVEINTVYPINIRILYVPLNGEHVSGVNTVMEGSKSLRLFGMYSNDKQNNGIAITNIEDNLIVINSRVTYVSNGETSRTTTVTFEIPARSTKVFMITDKFFLPENYVGTLEIQSTGNVIAVGVTVNDAIEFTNVK